jgi:tetratricopeptide (TPR) repeat protein
MRRWMQHQVKPFSGLVIIALLALAAAAGSTYAPILVEEAMLVLDRDAARAYRYGSAHFDARKTASYDIARAETLFKRALAIDPSVPYAKHQLARIYFIQGDFVTALRYINEELAEQKSPSASSYYIRGLILGYMGRYEEAAKDYAEYLTYDPTNWAALNDYAWVLLKGEKFFEAREALARGLKSFPENPWLLNSYAIALFELGDFEAARPALAKAEITVERITEQEWHTAYPGNDPRIASEGIRTLRESIKKNKQRLEDRD